MLGVTRAYPIFYIWPGDLWRVMIITAIKGGLFFMNGKCMPRMIRVSFYAFYQQVYAPSFCAIDVALKTMEKPFTLRETADLLQLSQETVHAVMRENSITRLDKNGFLTLMGCGESNICRMYRRELARGAKADYSPADIAYIYELDETHVQGACEKLGIGKKCPRSKVTTVLDQLFVFILY